MLERPKLKPLFVAKSISGEGVLFLTEKDYFFRFGNVIELLSPYINGSHSTAEIIELLAGKASEEEIRNTIQEMENSGLLIEANPEIPDSESAFWWNQGINPESAVKRLQDNPISLHTVGNVSAVDFQKMLEAFRIRIAEPGLISVVLTDSYLREELSGFNEESFQVEKSWMLVKPVGTVVWIGPIFVPARTGCWECLAHRLRMHKSAEAFLRKRGEIFDAPSQAYLSPTINIALNIAATKVARWIVQDALPELEGKIVSYDVLTGKMDSHTLLRRPQCPACGDIIPDPSREMQPIRLRSTRKNFTTDGGHRVTVPEATFEKYEHHISPITGVIPELTPYGISKAGSLHVYGAEINSVVSPNRLGHLKSVIKNSGKGASDAQARTSALAESLERYSGAFFGEELRRKASFLDLGDKAIHPNQVMHYSDQQYENRQVWNARNQYKMLVPEPFREDEQMEWSPVWSLTRNEVRFLPTAYCYYDYPMPQPTICLANSNGCAAGNTLEEAILQGFFELFERDGVGIWWYNRLRKAAVDWKSFELPYLHEVEKYHNDLKRQLWVLDLSTDLRVPVFAAISRCMDPAKGDQIIFGWGSHLDPQIAMLRAMTELNQALVWTAKNQAFPLDLFENLKGDLDSNAITVNDIPYVLPDQEKRPRVLGDYPKLWTDDLKDDVVVLQKIVEKAGMELMILDQTRADIGLPVVKVIVPEMRHMWPRFAPGRLYDVPVRLGERSEPLPEEELNSILVFT